MSQNYDQLPDDVWFNIFRFLSFADLIRFGNVCKRWRELTTFDPLMRIRFTLIDLNRNLENLESLTKCVL